MTEEAHQLAIRAIRGGTFYAACRTSVAAWWWDAMAELGFGSSHATFKFNWDLFWKIVSMADDEEDYILRFVLSWAGYDGSIVKDYFEVIVPADEDVGEQKTVRVLFHHIFYKYFGIKTGNHNERFGETEIENGKSITCIRLVGKKERRRLAEKLLPIAEKWRKNSKRNYLSHDRYENLRSWIEF